MENPRRTGLILIGIGILLFAATAEEALPPEAFWAGLFTYPIGGYLFFQGSRAAIRKAEERTRRVINPRLRNETAEHYAETQAEGIARRGSVEDLARTARKQSNESPALDRNMSTDDGEVALLDVPVTEAPSNPEELQITSDVSFPIEIQQQDSLADQIQKLQRLLEGGIISAEEFSIAKAKLLG